MCFAVICCQCQCDCCFLPELLFAVATGVLCCAAFGLVSVGIPATVAGLETTAAAGAEAGIIGTEVVGLGLVECCTADTMLASVGLVLCPCLCLPCFYADNAQLVDGNHHVTTWTTDCVGCTLASICCMGWVVTSTKRKTMRYSLGIKDDGKCYGGEAHSDAVIHFCCMPCALIQERKILVKNKCTRKTPAILRYKEIMAAGAGGVVTAQPIEMADNPAAAPAAAGKKSKLAGFSNASSVGNKADFAGKAASKE
jgi:Cys-rich protein (TIGR01571 family)